MHQGTVACSCLSGIGGSSFAVSPVFSGRYCSFRVHSNLYASVRPSGYCPRLCGRYTPRQIPLFVVATVSDELRPTTYQGVCGEVCMSAQILIVDDSPFLRRSIRWSIEQNTDWQVCGEAEKWAGCYRKNQGVASRPDYSGFGNAHHEWPGCGATHRRFCSRYRPYSLHHARLQGTVEIRRVDWNQTGALQVQRRHRAIAEHRSSTAGSEALVAAAARPFKSTG